LILPECNIVNIEVKGKVPTLKLINIPWDQAMDVILKNYGLDKQVDGNIIRIAYNSVFAKEFEEKVRAGRFTVFKFYCETMSSFFSLMNNFL